MTLPGVEQPNVEKAVPFFIVSEIEHSLRFYVEGLGFQVAHRWIDEGKLRWCWLQCGGADLMLQQGRAGQSGLRLAETGEGRGVSVYFLCKDALAIYHALLARGIKPRTPFVGNGLWVVGLSDPDGYPLFFESPAEGPEETVYLG